MSKRLHRTRDSNEDGPVILSLMRTLPGDGEFRITPTYQSVLCQATAGGLELEFTGRATGRLVLETNVDVTGSGGLYDIIFVEATSAHGSAKVDPSMIRLEAAASTGDEPAFLDALKEMHWSNRPPMDYVRGVQLALESGAHLAARRLATEGVRRYPHNMELQKYAHVLAPPKVIRSNVPANPGLKANREWLQTHSEEYSGKWVALRDGQLLGDANSLDELIKKIGNTKGVLLTTVG
ncbi:MAG TPA: hypothetical protein VNO70_01490 [Blastocatellia bacterium]|nr:hypothetical protein [Blastocatellia bacterium]